MLSNVWHINNLILLSLSFVIKSSEMGRNISSFKTESHVEHFFTLKLNQILITVLKMVIQL